MTENGIKEMGIEMTSKSGYLATKILREYFNGFPHLSKLHNGQVVVHRPVNT
jgi:hypothetical protein